MKVEDEALLKELKRYYDCCIEGFPYAMDANIALAVYIRLKELLNINSNQEDNMNSVTEISCEYPSYLTNYDYDTYVTSEISCELINVIYS